MVRSRIAEIVEYRSMLWSLILSELRTRYKGSILGFLWTFVNPLLMLVIYSLVFSFIMRVSIKHYSAFLFIGILAWNMFASSVQGSASVIVNRSSLVKKIYFPRAILPMSVVGGALVNYLLSFAILIPFLLLSGIRPTFSWSFVPLILLFETFLALGLSLLCASLNVYFRDLEHMLGIFLMAWFYLTPVVYTYTIIPNNLLLVFKSNPMSGILIMLQDVLFYGHSVRWKLFVYTAVISILVLYLGWAVFERLNRRLAEEV